MGGEYNLAIFQIRNSKFPREGLGQPLHDYWRVSPANSDFGKRKEPFDNFPRDGTIFI